MLPDNHKVRRNSRLTASEHLRLKNKEIAEITGKRTDCAADIPYTKGIKASPKVIPLKERSMAMLKKDLLLRNPFKHLDHDIEANLSEGCFGAVLARAGVGKTALLVQLALRTLLQGKNVLHVSLNDPVHKVTLWYQEVFNCIAEQYGVGQAEELWEAILPHRFIMTFKVEGFSVPKLEERLSDLTEQEIFKPQMILVDGLPFSREMTKPLAELKTFAMTHGIHVWFAVRTHRRDPMETDGMPHQLSDLEQLFEIILQLQPDGSEIHIHTLKGRRGSEETAGLVLDPETLLIKNSRS